MNKKKLHRHLKEYKDKFEKEVLKASEDYRERLDHIAFFKSYTENKIRSMTEEDLYSYIAGLWAMRIWGNKQYVIDKLIDNNGLDNLRSHIADLVYGSQTIEKRWTTFRSNIKGMGPAMISEILCKTHPDKYMLWNRRAYIALRYIEAEDLPHHDYQITGKRYKYLCDICHQIAEEFKKFDFEDRSLLAVDYFFWESLQVEENLSKILRKPLKKDTLPETKEEVEFIHNDIRDKLREIGQWLGFIADIEKKVAEGSKVDTVWESTIGNMGRVIYVFEVQTKGSIDSLILNLLKSLNNPAVQGVVAVSDKKQLEKINKHASEVSMLKDKLKLWDYEEILKVHESLEYVNESINELKLVPKGF